MIKIHKKSYFFVDFKRETPPKIPKLNKLKIVLGSGVEVRLGLGGFVETSLRTRETSSNNDIVETDTEISFSLEVKTDAKLFKFFFILFNYCYHNYQHSKLTTTKSYVN